MAGAGGVPERRGGGWRDVVVPLVAGLLVTAIALVVVDAAGRGEPAPRAGAGAREAPRADAAASGRSLFARMGCGNCHALRAGNSRARGAPDLDDALPGHTRESLREKIVRPYGDDATGSFTHMPTDFGRRMSGAELDALVAFLLDGVDRRTDASR